VTPDDVTVRLVAGHRALTAEERAVALQILAPWERRVFGRLVLNALTQDKATREIDKGGLVYYVRALAGMLYIPPGAFLSISGGLVMQLPGRTVVPIGYAIETLAGLVCMLAVWRCAGCLTARRRWRRSHQQFTQPKSAR
jgi:hypothetical protein